MFDLRTADADTDFELAVEGGLDARDDTPADARRCEYATCRRVLPDTVRADARYCSTAHRKAAHRSGVREDRRCLMCDKRLRPRQRYYCSHVCKMWEYRHDPDEVLTDPRTLTGTARALAEVMPAADVVRLADEDTGLTTTALADIPADVLQRARGARLVWWQAQGQTFGLQWLSATRLLVVHKGHGRAVVTVHEPVAPIVSTPRMCERDGCANELVGRQRRFCSNACDRATQRGVVAFTGVDIVLITGETTRARVYSVRIGEEELYTGAPLTHVQVFEWLAQHRRTTKAVGWALSVYGWSALLADAPRDKVKRIGSRKTIGAVEIDGWWVALRTQARFAIADHDPGKGNDYRYTVADVNGLCHGTLVQALDTFNIGTADERKLLADTDVEVRPYTLDELPRLRAASALRVRLLVDLLTEVERLVRAEGIRSNSWHGAGPIADHIMWRARIDDHRGTAPRELEGILRVWKNAPRVEVFRFGWTPDAHRLDISGAFAWAVAQVPCIADGHGEWVNEDVDDVEPDDFALYTVSWDAPDATVGPLPWRLSRVNLWPQSGVAYAWGPEVAAARALYGRDAVKVHERWVWYSACDCERPFARLMEWLNEWRFRLDAELPGSGALAKSVMVAAVGKAAQQVGGGSRFTCDAWTSFVQSAVRARLLEVVGVVGPERVVSFMTDGVIIEGAPDGLDLREGLGRWKVESLGAWFAVEQGRGTNAGGTVVKTQGIVQQVIVDASGYRRLADAVERDGWAGKVAVVAPTWVSLTDAVNRHRPQDAARWVPRRFRLALGHRERLPLDGGRTLAPVDVAAAARCREWHYGERTYERVGALAVSALTAYGVTVPEPPTRPAPRARGRGRKVERVTFTDLVGPDK